MQEESIFELQGYLRSLYLAGRKIPLLNPDGIYGPETREGIRSFQNLAGLPPTGEADYETWERLRTEALEAEIRPLPLPVFPEERPEAGEGWPEGELLLFQALLSALHLQYENLPSVSITGEYDRMTEQAVLQLQRLMSLPETGLPDLRLWNQLVNLWK